MKLRIKIPSYFGGALLLSLAAGVAGLLVLGHSLDTFQTDVMRQVDDERAVAALSGHFKSQIQEWKDTLLRGSDSKLLETHWGGFRTQQQAVDDGARALAGRLGDAALNAQLAQFVEARKKMAAGYAEGFDKFERTGFDASVGDAAVRGIDREPARLLDALATGIAQRRARVAEGAFDQGRRALWLALGLMALACAGGMVIGLRLARGVVGPLLAATRVTRDVATGDLTQPVVVAGDEETAGLLRSLAQMQAQLRELVGSVRGNAHGLEVASTEIAQGNQDLSRRTEEQAAALQVTASAMAQLGATALSSADGARTANDVATQARAIATEGGAAVERVVATMKGIDASSRRIAEIIGVIDGIAFQTNILALNAAVEAARAGEQGRGFAVVAAEVRSLAARSSTAAREIKALIASSVEQVENGSRIADEAGQTVREIVAAIHRVGDLVGAISHASQDQRASVDQVGGQVGRLDQTTQQNASLVEESAAAADSLRQQAHQLVAAVAAFRL